MSRKDISDLQVCLAYEEMNRQQELLDYKNYETAESILARTTGQPIKVCYKAIERAFDRGYLNYGVSLRTGWLEDLGKQLIKENR